MDFAAVAERNAEAAFSNSDMKQVAVALNTVKKCTGMTRDSLVASKKTPGRDAELYKYAELRSRELLTRLDDLERRMPLEERGLAAVPKARVEEIHDFWFDAIMSTTE